MLAEQTAENGRGIVPRRNGYFEGLAAIYPMQAVEIAATALRGEDYSMQNFVRVCVEQNLITPISVAEDEMELYQNINTPKELEKVAP